MLIKALGWTTSASNITVMCPDADIRIFPATSRNHMHFKILILAEFEGIHIKSHYIKIC